MRAPGVTGVGETLVDVSFAALPYVSCRAGAVVASDSIHTLPFVETLGLFGDWVGERVAVVNVDLTVNTCNVRFQWFRKREQFTPFCIKSVL